LFLRARLAQPSVTDFIDKAIESEGGDVDGKLFAGLDIFDEIATTVFASTMPERLPRNLYEPSVWWNALMR
jgi:hypothetical protein